MHCLCSSVMSCVFGGCGGEESSVWDMLCIIWRGVEGCVVMGCVVCFYQGCSNDVYVR